jgi:hypothetical protein
MQCYVWVSRANFKIKPAKDKSTPSIRFIQVANSATPYYFLWRGCVEHVASVVDKFRNDWNKTPGCSDSRPDSPQYLLLSSLRRSTATCDIPLLDISNNEVEKT